MPPFLTIFALEHTWVHIHPSDGGNVVSYIKTSVDKALSLASTLDILNVQLDDGHI